MPTELSPLAAKRPRLSVLRVLLCALSFGFGVAGARAQIGIIGPSAPAPEYILLGQGHNQGACAASAPDPAFQRSGRRGGDSNSGGASQIDPKTGAPCPPK
jgi:hypothetical protein